MEPAASFQSWPSAPTWPVLGHIPTLMSRGFMRFVEDSWRSLGDCFEIRVGGHSVKIVVHPDDVEAMLLTRRERYIKGDAYEQFRQVVGEGLITSEGALWRQQRRLIQPSFGRQTIAGLGAQIVRSTEAMLDRWTRELPAGEIFDVHQQLMHLTLEIIGHGLFSLELGDERSSLSTRAFGESLEILGDRIVALMVPPPWLPTPANRRLRRAIRALDEVVRFVIDGRRERGELGEDLLAALLRGHDEQGQPLSDEQIRDEIITMFLAGHETTAVALSWTLWLLSRNPEAMQRLVAELDEVLGGRTPTVEDLGKLSWTRQVFLEAMRLVPPAWGGARNCVADDELGEGLGLRLPVYVGERVIHVMHLTHRHPGFWSAPERFDPERFDPAAAAGRHNFAYTPFSAGPRKCVGQHFATMEAQLVLACMLQRVCVEVPAEFEPVPEYTLTTRPKTGMQLRWRERASLTR